MHRHHLLGFHSDTLAAIQPCLHSKIHTTQRALRVCVWVACLCMCMRVILSVSTLYILVQMHMCMYAWEWLWLLMRVGERLCVSMKGDVCCNLHCQFVQPKIRMLSGAEKASLCVTVIVPLCLLLLSWKHVHARTHAGTHTHKWFDKKLQPAIQKKGT